LKPPSLLSRGIDGALKALGAPTFKYNWIYCRGSLQQQQPGLKPDVSVKCFHRIESLVLSLVTSGQHVFNDMLQRGGWELNLP